MYKQQVRLFKWGNTINDNENETENEKKKKKTRPRFRHEHTKWVSVWSWLYIKKHVNVYIKTAVNVM